MRKISNYLVCAMLAWLVAGCNLTGSVDQAEYIPVKIDSDGEWGLLGADGEPLFVNEFKHPISNVVDGVFLARENHAYTIYKAEKTPVPLGSCENLLTVGLPNEGKIIVCTKDNSVEVISSEGSKVFTLPERMLLTQAYFRDGLLGVCDSNGKWGFVDEKGTQVIPCKFDGVSTFSEGFAVAANIANEKVALLIINKKGETVARVKNTVRLASNNPTFVGGRIPAVNSDDQYGFLTTEGAFEKCSAKVKGIGDVSDNRFIFKNADSKYGAMDYEGNILIQPRYDELKFVPGSDKYLSKINTTYSLLDKNGNKLKEFSEYSDMEPGVNKFPLIATLGKRFEILDSDGNLLSQETYAEVGESTTSFAKEYIFRTKEIEASVIHLIKESLKYMFNRFDTETQQAPGLDEAEELWNSLGLNFSSDSIPESEATLDANLPTAELATTAQAAEFSSYIPAGGSQGSIHNNPFAYLSSHELTDSEVSQFSKEELRILRNALYAMHGHVFKSPDLREYFMSFSWYSPVGDASNKLTPIEKKNLVTIQRYE